MSGGEVSVLEVGGSRSRFFYFGTLFGYVFRDVSVCVFGVVFWV